MKAKANRLHLAHQDMLEAHSSPDYMKGLDLAPLRRLIRHVEVATMGFAYDLDLYYQAEVENHP